MSITRSITYTPMSPLLPAQSGEISKPTLVLDLDETLISSRIDENATPDYTFTIGKVTVVGKIRPHIREFFEMIKDHFEIVVFTAGIREYGEKITELIDPTGEIFAHKLYRENCVSINEHYIKDLALLNRDLAKTIIVDNSPNAFAYHPDNGIPIESWYGYKWDTELIHIGALLVHIISHEDVRDPIRKIYKMQERINDEMKELCPE